MERLTSKLKRSILRIIPISVIIGAAMLLFYLFSTENIDGIELE